MSAMKHEPTGTDEPEIAGMLRLPVLRALMAERHWTKARLAQEAGLYPSTVGRLLDGKAQPDWATRGKLLAVFPHVDSDDLFVRVGRAQQGTAT